MTHTHFCEMCNDDWQCEIRHHTDVDTPFSISHRLCDTHSAEVSSYENNLPLYAIPILRTRE